MKHSLKIVLFVLLLCGVFGADEVKPVSVMEGDSVTLTPDPAKIQGFIKIQWRFGEKLIAQTRGTEISIEYEDIFRGRLQLNHQTGSLTIKNMRTKHSGLYKLQIYHNTGSSDQTFTVAVYESPSVDAIKFVMKTESVTEGDPVTLHTDVTELQGDELIVWTSGDEGKLIAKHDLENKSSSLYYDEKRFRDRLKLDQTGSLTITNTRTTDSGLYKVKISSNNQILYKRFTLIVSAVPVPGLSGGEVAGIVISVLLAVAAAVAAGVMYYRCSRTTNLPNQTLWVTEGDDVTLNPETEIQRGDEIQWLFGDKEQTVQTEIKNTKGTKYDDWRFRDRLKLSEGTGSLTITNTTAEHTGYYTLKIRRGREKIYKRFHVSVVERRLVMEGESVTLEPAYEIKKDDLIQWLFGDEEQTVLTEIKNTKGTKYAGTDERFRDRLELNEETGDLTITNTTAEHTEFYTLKITRGRDKIYKRFYICVVERKITLMEGKSVTLEPARKIKKDDVIQWLFGDEEQQTGIAEFNGKTGEIFIYDDVADERFRGRLELDETTGSLTITNTRTEHSGVYKLEIRSSSGDSEQTFTVTVRVEEKFLKRGASVTLKPDTEIQSDDQILWMFGDQDKLIAQIRGGRADIYDDVNKRFRGRLKLDKMTGSLTITKIEAKHTGLYKLQIISSSGETFVKRFKVLIKPRNVELTPGESVRLNTGLTEIQRDDEIQWRFGDENSLIAEIKGGTGVTHDGPDKRFRDRLELNKKTGDLIIKNSKYEHTGEYKLKISSSGGNTNSTYRVFIKKRKVEVAAGESVRLNTDLNEIQTEDEIQWRFGDKNSLIAEIKGGTGVTHDGPDERFRDRLELDEKTGDLTIKNSTAEHAGDYKLKIRRSKGNTNRTYSVIITARFVEVAAGESVRLHTALNEIQTEDEIQWRFGNKNSLIAKMNGGTGVTHDGPDERFRDRLELNKKTGDLIIKNSTYEHAGRYKLKIRRSGGTTNSKYSVTIRGAAVTKEVRTESSMKEKTDSRRKRVNESATVEMPLLNGEDLDVVNEEEGTSLL